MKETPWSKVTTVASKTVLCLEKRNLIGKFKGILKVNEQKLDWEQDLNHQNQIESCGVWEETDVK